MVLLAILMAPNATIAINPPSISFIRRVRLNEEALGRLRIVGIIERSPNANVAKGIETFASFYGNVANVVLGRRLAFRLIGTTPVTTSFDRTTIDA